MCLRKLPKHPREQQAARVFQNKEWSIFIIISRPIFRPWLIWPLELQINTYLVPCLNRCNNIRGSQIHPGRKAAPTAVRKHTAPSLLTRGKANYTVIEQNKCTVPAPELSEPLRAALSRQDSGPLGSYMLRCVRSQYSRVIWGWWGLWSPERFHSPQTHTLTHTCAHTLSYVNVQLPCIPMEHLHTLTHAHPCTLTFSLSHTHKHTFSDTTALPPKHENLLPQTLDFCPLSKCQGLSWIQHLITSQALNPDEACLLSGNTPLPQDPGQSGTAGQPMGPCCSLRVWAALTECGLRLHLLFQVGCSETPEALSQQS